MHTAPIMLLDHICLRALLQIIYDQGPYGHEAYGHGPYGPGAYWTITISCGQNLQKKRKELSGFVPPISVCIFFSNKHQ